MATEATTNEYDPAPEWGDVEPLSALSSDQYKQEAPLIWTGTEPAYLHHTMVLVEHMQTLDDFTNTDIDHARFLLTHALLQADESLTLKALLPSVEDPNHKLQLFYTASTLETDAGVEVMATYNMGQDLENEFQAEPDKQKQLAALLSIKILAGLDEYTSLEKLKLLCSAYGDSICPTQNFTPSKNRTIEDRALVSIHRRVVAKLLDEGNYESARSIVKLTGVWIAEVAIDLMIKLADTTKLGNRQRKSAVGQIAEEVHQSLNDGKDYYDRGYVQYSKVKKALLQIIQPDGSVDLTVHTGANREGNPLYRFGSFADAISQITKPIKAPLTDQGLAGATPLREAIDQIAKRSDHRIDGDIQRLNQSTDNQEKVNLTISIFERAVEIYATSPDQLAEGTQTLMHIIRVGTFLVAHRINVPEAELISHTQAKLSVIDSERQPTQEHFLRLDYYYRAEQQRLEKEAASAALVIAEQSSQASTRLALLTDIIAFCEGSMHDLSKITSKAEEIRETTFASIASPLLKRIAGVVPDQSVTAS